MIPIHPAMISGPAATAVLFVPATPLLIRELAGEQDPVADLRRAVGRGLSWLAAQGDGDPVTLVVPGPGPAHAEAGFDAGRFTGTGDPQGSSAAATPVGIGRCLLSLAGLGEAAVIAAGSPGEPAGVATRAVLVLGGGSARRSDTGPGHLDPRAQAFDELIARALSDGDPSPLAALDRTLAGELLADCDALIAAAAWAQRFTDGRGSRIQPVLDYAQAPHGVSYFVARWSVLPG